MGRKIPGRKHHGVRDPEKQRIERLKSIRHKINAPPLDPDDQQIPKSLQRFAELRTKYKQGVTLKKKKKVQPRGQFVQHPGESDRAFMLRVNRQCAIVKHEAAFADKYGVEIKRNEKGEVESVQKRPKDILHGMLKEARKKKQKGKSKASNEEKLTKSQKRRLKLAAKKQKKIDEKVNEWEHHQDFVKFGEQAHAPPSLSFPLKGKIKGDTPRPGARNLLLKSVLDNGSRIDTTGKRKDLPNALRRQLEEKQQEAVKAYRLLKKTQSSVF